MTTGLLNKWSTRAATRTIKSGIAQIAGLTPSKRSANIAAI